MKKIRFKDRLGNKIVLDSINSIQFLVKRSSVRSTVTTHDYRIVSSSDTSPNTISKKTYKRINKTIKKIQLKNI